MSALDWVQHASACAEKMTVDLQADPFVDIEALGIKQNGSKRSAEIQAVMHLFVIIYSCMLTRCFSTMVLAWNRRTSQHPDGSSLGAVAFSHVLWHHIIHITSSHWWFPVPRAMQHCYSTCKAWTHISRSFVDLHQVLLQWLFSSRLSICFSSCFWLLVSSSNF